MNFDDLKRNGNFYNEKPINIQDAQNSYFISSEQFKVFKGASLQKSEISAAEILVKFLRFYGYSFNPFDYAIDIS